MTKTANTSGATTSTATAQGQNLAAVFTDLAIATDWDELDRAYRAEYAVGTTCETPDAEFGTPVGPRLLAAFVARYQAMANAYYARSFSSLTPPRVVLDATRRGQRFVRIVQEETNSQVLLSRSVLGFIEAATGRLFKADTFRKPATNFSRGDIRMIPPAWMVHFGSIG